MRPFLILPVLVSISACGAGESDLATFTCPNGPDIAVTYTDEAARLVLPGGRVETLPATESEDVYARPGVVWNVAGFRSARLTDGEKSYQCDQMAG